MYYSLIQAIGFRIFTAKTPPGLEATRIIAQYRYFPRWITQEQRMGNGEEEA
jgi:hypothetical protein